MAEPVRPNLAISLHASNARLRRELMPIEDRYGTVIKGASRDTVSEEIPEAYKDVASVVDAVEIAGISRKVARLRPLGVIKG